jgi:hypothetical protein
MHSAEVSGHQEGITTDILILRGLASTTRDFDVSTKWSVGRRSGPRLPSTKDLKRPERIGDRKRESMSLRDRTD